MTWRIWFSIRAAILVCFGHLKRRLLLYVIGFVLLILIALFSIWAYTEILWYIAVGYADVLTTMVTVQFWMGLLPFIAMSLLIITTMNLARKLAPADRMITSDERTIDRWRRALDPVAKPLITAIGLMCGLILALETHVHWDTWLLYENGEEWGRTDPQFGRDLSYFMFRLPLYTLINKWAFVGLLVALILTALTSYLYGGLRPQAEGAKIPALVNIHLSVFLIILMAILGWGLILELHLLSYSERGVITGLGFTDANASLVAYQFVATAVVSGFILFQINIRRPGWILPTIALIWLFLIGLAAARFYPNLYQLLIVEPQELEREYPHIESHLKFTRYGFDLEDTERRRTPGNFKLDPKTREDYKPSLEALRLWDPETLKINMQELQALRSYYEFLDVDVDRYEVDGKTKLVMVGAREVNERKIPDGSRRWQAERMIYTHGYGLVAADPTRFTKAGLPVFYTQDLPPKGEDAMIADNPRIYYGENSPHHSFVSTKTIELDHPIRRKQTQEKAPEEGAQDDAPLPLMDDLSGIAARIERLEKRLESDPEQETEARAKIAKGAPPESDNGNRHGSRAANGSDRGETHANAAEDQGASGDSNADRDETPEGLENVPADDFIASSEGSGQGGETERDGHFDGAQRGNNEGGADGEAGSGTSGRNDCPKAGLEDGKGRAGSSDARCSPDDVGFAFYDYGGKGGITIDSLVDRLAFAVRFWEIRLALTLLVDGEARVMFHRQIRDRVQRVAPYLQMDRNPYPVAVDGRIKWIIDAYTVSDMMPYSRRVNLSDLTQINDPKQHGSTLIPEEFIRSEAGLSGTANYIRGSVKAVVDAYDGTIDLYAVDPSDKVLQAWTKVFENSFKPLEDAPDALKAHFRYPHDLFKIQSVIWSDYHMQSPEAFYTREAAWRIPPDASFISLRRERQESEHEKRRADLRPYWLYTQFPGEKRPQFAIVQPFSPDQRNVLSGYLVGLSDGERYGRAVSYAFPPTTTILGPAQAQARIDQDARISAWTTLRMQSGSRVSRGRLLALPIGDALIYLQPLFVQADKSEVSELFGAQLSSIPELKKVVALFGDTVVMRPTLEEAVAAVFDEAPGPAGAPPDETDGSDTPTASGGTGSSEASEEQARALGLSRDDGRTLQ